MNLPPIHNKIFLLILMTFFCCSKSADGIQSIELFYNNDFESGDLNAIDGAQLMTFNNTTVLGNYNNDGFTLNLSNIGTHDLIYISFDLYVHDSWDGNFNNLDPDQPDTWIIELRTDIDANTSISSNIWETSFSNSVCNPLFCLNQSYPNVYPLDNPPREGSTRTFPGFCSLGSESDGTTLYTIEKGFEHTGDALQILFYDRLYQPNAVDEKCDESWSLDNLKIRIVESE